jgi:AcrR family transcriptional regulator
MCDLDPKGTRQSNIALRRLQAQATGDPEYQNRRNQIFAAAGEVFRRKGYDSASVSDFAEAVGIDRASIYYYISGKEELFHKLVYDAVAENVRMVESVLHSAQPPDEKFRSFVVGLMRSYERHYPYLFLYIQEDMTRVATKDSEWARDIRGLSERFDAAVRGIIDEGIAAGRIDGSLASPGMIARAVVGMCNWSHRWFRPDGKAGAEEIGRAFAAIVLNGILTPADR